MTSSFDAVPDPIIRVDGERIIVEANDAAGRLAGGRPDDIVGKSLTDVFAPRGRDGSPLLTKGWHKSAGLSSVTGMPEHEIRITTARGLLRARVTGRYERDADGLVTGATLSIRPPRRGADDAPTGSEVVSTVSHELRSPLTSVKGYTSLLLNRWDRIKDDQKRMMLEQIHHDADRVTRLITELLDISRLETGHLTLRRQTVDLADLAEQVVGKLRMAYPDLDCTLAFPVDLPDVYADSDKLEQVITNLVENAAKYASTQGMRIIGSTADGTVSVSVSDAGEGIPPGDLSKVFTKFFRRDLGRPTGTGLGLWISRGLVEAHGGRLVAESTVGKGSTFTFTLPLVSVDDLLDS